jgi:hypothetical protein
MNLVELRRERFLNEFFKNGGDAKAAYLTVCKKTNMTEGSLNIGVNRYLNDPIVLQRIEDFQKQMVNSFSMSTAKALEELKVTQKSVLEKILAIANDPEENGNVRMNGWLKIGMLMGMFTPAAVNKTNNNTQVQVYEINYSVPHGKTDGRNNSISVHAPGLPITHLPEIGRGDQKNPDGVAQEKREG